MNRDSRGADIGVALCLGLATLGLNVPALVADSFLFDDIRLVFANPLVVDRAAVPLGELLRTSSVGYPMPLSMAVWGTIHAAVGLSVPLLHALNAIVHASTVALLFAVARDLGAQRGAAAAGAALLAVHPVSAEPVAWMAQLGVLAAALPALALVPIARRWVRAQSDSGPAWGAAIVVVFLLALGLHPTVVGLPLLVPYLAWAAPRRPDGRSAVVVTGACLAFAAAAAASTLRVHSARQWLVGDESLGDHLFTIVAIADIHARNLALPWELRGWYDRPPAGIAVAVRGAVAFVVGLAALGTAALHPRTRGGSIGVGAAFAALTYAPHSGIPVAGIRFAAESHAYLPLVGLSLAASGAIDAAVRRYARRRQSITAVVVASWLGLATLHVAHQQRYRDPDRFWMPVHHRDPFHPTAAWALGFSDLMAADGTEIWTRDALVPAVGWWARANLYHGAHHDRALALDPHALTSPIRQVLQRLDEPMAASCARDLDARSSMHDFEHCFSLVADAATRSALVAELDTGPP